MNKYEGKRGTRGLVSLIAGAEEKKSFSFSSDRPAYAGVVLHCPRAHKRTPWWPRGWTSSLVTVLLQGLEIRIFFLFVGRAVYFFFFKQNEAGGSVFFSGELKSGLTPAGAGAAEELVGLGVPEELAEALPFAQLRRPGVELLGLLVRHRRTCATHYPLREKGRRMDRPGGAPKGPAHRERSLRSAHQRYCSGRSSAAPSARGRHRSRSAPAGKSRLNSSWSDRENACDTHFMNWKYFIVKLPSSSLCKLYTILQSRVKHCLAELLRR